MKSVKKTVKNAESVEIPERAIRKLSEIIRSTDLAEIEVAQNGLSIRVRAKEAHAAMVSSYSAPMVASPAAAATTARPAAVASESSDLHVVRSPFVGTFYRSPSPNSPPFVEVGQTISKGQVLCIVEAMKIMNEIEADSSGLVDKIFVEDGQVVEFNAPLFALRKA